MKNLEKEIFKLNSSEDLVNFLVNVECDNSEKISELVRSNVNIFFELSLILNDLNEKISEDEYKKVMFLILELHQKLLKIKKHYNDIDKFLDLYYEDGKLMYNCLKVNKELIL